MLRHIIFYIFLIVLHLHCRAQVAISKSATKNTLVVRLTCNDTLQIRNSQGILYERGHEDGNGHPIHQTGKWTEFSGDSLTLPLDMIEEMSIIKGQEIIRSQFTLGDSIGIVGDNDRKWFVDSIFPARSSITAKEQLHNSARWDCWKFERFRPCIMVFMDDPDDTNGLKSWGEYQGYNNQRAWGGISPMDFLYHKDGDDFWWYFQYKEIGDDIAHTQYDYYANIAVDEAKQHGVDLSYADSPIWMASKADVEYLLKNCGRDIIWEPDLEETFHMKVHSISERNGDSYLRLYNPNDVCLYIASRQITSSTTYFDESYRDPVTSITTVSQRTLRDCPQNYLQTYSSQTMYQFPAKYACLWTSTLAPEGDDRTKAWALQITPEGCCLIKLDRATKLPALMVGRPIDPNVVTTRKNINLKY